MFKDLSMRIFLGDFMAFVAGVLVSAAINHWLTPGTLWWPWVLIGWGVAVAVHAFALLLRKTRRRERIFVDRKARAFAVHLFAYVAVVLVLLCVNLTLTPKVWWFYWVALGWGLGLAFQGWCTFFKTRKKTPAGAPQRAEVNQVESKAKPPEKKPARKRAPAKRKPKA